MAIRLERRLTYEDYARFPEDGRRWEIIDGEAFVIPPPNARHQRILGDLLMNVSRAVDERGEGYVTFRLDVVMSKHDIVQPDLIFVSDAARHVLTDDNIQGIPTWIVEVVSDPVRDKLVKRDLYARHGVPEYWTVDPELRTVETYHAGEDRLVLEPPELAEPTHLPGLRIDLEKMFGPPGPRRLP